MAVVILTLIMTPVLLMTLLIMTLVIAMAISMTMMMMMTVSCYQLAAAAHLETADLHGDWAETEPGSSLVFRGDPAREEEAGDEDVNASRDDDDMENIDGGKKKIPAVILKTIIATSIIQRLR